MHSVNKLSHPYTPSCHGAGARVELQAKEGELRDAYDRLAVGARERADVRAALVASQTELAGARAELDAWAQARLDAGQAQARAVGGDAEVRSQEHVSLASSHAECWLPHYKPGGSVIMSSLSVHPGVALWSMLAGRIPSRHALFAGALDMSVSYACRRLSAMNITALCSIMARHGAEEILALTSCPHPLHYTSVLSVQSLTWC